MDAVLVDVAAVDATGLIRYRLHDLLRAFAREYLEEAEPPGVREESLARLADQYIGAARLASALVHPGTPDPEAASAPRLLAEAGIMRSLGTLYRELGRYDEAVALLTRTADIFENHGDRQRWATVLRNLGDVYRYQGRLTEAIETFSAGLAVFRSAGDPRSEPSALNGMADAYRGLSQLAEARSSFHACIGIYHDLADRLEEVRARIRYALVFRDQCLSEQAIPLLEQGLRVVREPRMPCSSRRLDSPVPSRSGPTYPACCVPATPATC